ncbi:putative lipid II flippase FtsW [bacterium CG06_land_8_20_14_3_00_33_50]|nr:MAG: putative lipid II flippase FtsW [bacterium CG10_big_fil_rev_8_21_14_0_10_33_18]PIU77005.1 MAG: putative lipid II flippase FtsW [bacterium CG06_land_8_20_14_3_00_33_50]PIW81757.1 MAG: putative lipid II flippase FtsW [bacterium CG_4_8_14_3_um_filter_33_28]
MREKIRSRKSDYILSITVFALLIIGIIMISSASVVLSYEKFGSNNYYVIRQIVNALIGIGFLIFFYLIDYRKLKKISPIFLILTIILLLLVFLIGFQYGGAKRWLHFGSFINVQPTEITKLAYVLYLAAWLENRGEKLRDFQYGLIPFVLMTVFIAFLIILQPDFGTTLVIILTAASMFVIAGASWQQIILGGFAGLAVVWLLIKSSSYRFARLSVFLDPSSDTQGIGYHINQALLAIGSGGLLGLGFGLSRQKYNYLPEPMGDSIFAIMAEEIGFLRVIIIILLFIVLAYRGYRIARLSPDTFGRLTAFGITTWLTIQAAINIAAMLSLVPLTGIPLPFISYGGSSLISSLAGIGILLNISKLSVKGEVYESPRGSWWNSRSHNSRSIRSRRVTSKR